jgi:hypothetical protein
MRRSFMSVRRREGEQSPDQRCPPKKIRKFKILTSSWSGGGANALGGTLPPVALSAGPAPKPPRPRFRTIADWPGP